MKKKLISDSETINEKKEEKLINKCQCHHH